MNTVKFIPPVKNIKTTKIIWRKEVIRPKTVNTQETYIVPIKKNKLMLEEKILASNKCDVIELINEYIDKKQIKKCSRLDKASTGDNVFNKEFYPECTQRMLRWIPTNNEAVFPTYLDGCPNKCEYFERPISRKAKNFLNTIKRGFWTLLEFIKNLIPSIINSIIKTFF